tara:strand:+ start:1604 stop:2626 length:1023 start_codon:yes stop_codon:yes gene_type:complete
MKNLRILLFVCLAVVFSCEKNNIEGPSLNDLYGELDIVEGLKIIGDSVDFENNETLHFTASFSKIVDWQIRIHGLTSGSVKIISGKSNQINLSNSRWDGSSTDLPFFVSNENCNVELTFEAHDDIIESTVHIMSAKDYNDENTVLITDFDDGWNPNFGEFFNSGMVRKIDDDGGAGQGTSYMVQESAPDGCPWDWLIGYVDYFSDFWFNENTLINDPSQVYFNILVKGDSTISISDNVPNSMLKIEFYEDENGDGNHDATSEDMYETGLIPVDWTGWRMISIRYDDIENLPAAPSSQGDGIRKPNEVYNVRTLLLANPNSGFAKADVDFLIWSIGSPILN